MYNIDFTKKASKEIGELMKNNPKQLRIIRSKISLLSLGKMKGKTLSGFSNLFSLRSGNYRIIYKFEGDIIIIIQTVGHRRNIYENLES